MRKKILTAILVVAVIALFVVFNVFFDNYTGTLKLEKDYIGLTYQVVEGDEAELTVELEKSDRIKVVYNGDYELNVIVNLRDINGKIESYRLRVYEYRYSGSDDIEVVTDWTRLD